MPFKGWREVAWRDVDAGTLVRTTDHREWIVRGKWNGERVLLAQDVSRNAARPVYGPVVPVPLADGDKTVRALLALDGKPATVPTLAERVGPHEFQPGNRGECWFADCKAPMDDPIHTPPPFAAPDADGPSLHEVAVRGAMTDTEREAINVRAGEPFAAEPAIDPWSKPLPKWGAPDPVTGTRSAMVPVPDAPKFGQPGGSQTAAERIRGEAPDDEGRAVAHLAAHFPDAELVAVEDEVDGIMVPRQLDDLALRSHLFLMHGRFYDGRDVERADLERDHRANHDTGDPGHTHVDRTP